MFVERSLALYDEGMALLHVIEDLLVTCGNRMLDMGTCLVKAALTMPDLSGNRIRTPIKRQIGPGCLEVRDLIIIINGSPCEAIAGEEQERILLWIGNYESKKGGKRRPRTTCSQISHFVAQIVTLRAVGSRQYSRNTA